MREISHRPVLLSQDGTTTGDAGITDDLVGKVWVWKSQKRGVHQELLDSVESQ
jgi:hypothetical protein